ncbi:MAG: hypothetical protein JWM56_223 [Candidatus Peribacteria bacterium]|nr:hypothetical protein [Candidatus Peribacteria bacterium]
MDNKTPVITMLLPRQKGYYETSEALIPSCFAPSRAYARAHDYIPRRNDDRPSSRWIGRVE